MYYELQYFLNIALLYEVIYPSSYTEDVTVFFYELRERDKERSISRGPCKSAHTLGHTTYYAFYAMYTIFRSSFLEGRTLKIEICTIHSPDIGFASTAPASFWRRYLRFYFPRVLLVRSLRAKNSVPFLRLVTLKVSHFLFSHGRRKKRGRFIRTRWSNKSFRSKLSWHLSVRHVWT